LVDFFLLSFPELVWGAQLFDDGEVSNPYRSDHREIGASEGYFDGPSNWSQKMSGNGWNRSLLLALHGPTGTSAFTPLSGKSDISG
jgi:hypothetical protein